MATMRPRISCASWSAPRRSTRGQPGRALLVALDGENAWEYYPYNGFYFLRALYKALADHPRLQADDAV